MKNKKFRTLVLLTGILTATITVAQKNKKVTYVFPPAMKPDIKAQYVKLCDKGQILYQINCGKCHNIMVKGRELIPDFTLEQLNGYEMRMGNQQHEANLDEERVTAEELGYIFTFLTYKSKSGYAQPHSEDATSH